MTNEEKVKLVYDMLRPNLEELMIADILADNERRRKRIKQELADYFAKQSGTTKDES